MKTFAEVQLEDRRLTILKGLASAVQWRANAFLLQSFCGAVGHAVGTDRIEQDLAWLEEQGLARIERSGDVVVATLTRRGHDVAEGRTVVPGVKQPLPGA